MKFLCHAGPWSDDYFRFVTKHISESSECKIVSGHKQIDETLLVESYYKFLSLPVITQANPSGDERDIIARCRLLRALDSNEAMHHLVSMRRAMEVVFDSEKPDIVITEAVDSFIIDLFCKESQKRNIPCIGLVTVFINGLSRISKYGEYNKSREVSDDEVATVLSTINRVDYLPSFVAKDTKKFRYNVIRRWFRNTIKIPYFTVKRWTSGDYYNYHYWHSIIICKTWFNWFPRFRIHPPNWELAIKQSSRPVVYLPLQMFPEATIDYWCEEVDVIDYENVLLETIRRFSGISFLVKEHPNVLGYRSALFYKALRSLGNVILCPTEIPSNALESYYNAVLVWTGTVGFEAAIRGKPVLAMSSPYYFKDNTVFYKVTADTSEDDVLLYIQQFENDVNKNDLVRHVLEGCIEGKTHFDGTWSADNSEHVAEALRVSESLKKYISRYVQS